LESVVCLEDFKDCLFIINFWS